MAKEKIIKTNAIRMLDKAKVPYIHRCWEQATGQHTGVELAQALGQDPAQVFKTLVTVAKSGEHYVFLVPVAEEKGCRCGRRKSHLHVQIQRPAAAHRIHPRRLFSHRHEKAVPYHHT